MRNEKFKSHILLQFCLDLTLFTYQTLIEFIIKIILTLELPKIKSVKVTVFKYFPQKLLSSY